MDSIEVSEDSSEIPSVKKKKPCHINMEMLRYKIHFTLLNGAYGLVIAYLALLCSERIGISASAFGIVLSADSILMIFVRILTAYIADYFNKLKALINIKIVTLTVVLSLLLAIPGIENGRSFTFFCQVENLNSTLSPSLDCAKPSTEHDTCYEYFRSDEAWEDVPCQQNLKKYFHSDVNVGRGNTIEIASGSEYNATLCSELRFCCENSSTLYSIQCKEYAVVAESEFYTYQFWLFAILFTISYICSSNLRTLSDTACYESVVKAGAKFGKQRLYATLSYGAFALLGGLLYDLTHDFVASIATMVFFCAACLWNLKYINISKVKIPKKIWKDVGGTFRNTDVLVFEFGVFLNGVSWAMVYYTSPFIASLGGSQIQNGLVGAVHALITIPFMFYSNWIIEKIGHFNCMSLSMIALIFKFLSFSYIVDPWLVAPVDLSFGITYGLFLPTMASFAKSYSKPGSEATTQSVIFSSYEDIGTAVGSLVFGVGSDYFGWSVVFFYSGIVYAVGTVIVLLYTLLGRGRNEFCQKM